MKPSGTAPVMWWKDVSRGVVLSFWEAFWVAESGDLGSRRIGEAGWTLLADNAGTGLDERYGSTERSSEALLAPLCSSVEP